ncbi:glycosyltransferase family 4 protein [bacterium]|nr:glycosyltransferase family 4 protein [bacterium]
MPEPQEQKSIVMFLDNAFRPDPRVAAEARSLVEAGYRVTLLAWDREGGRPDRENWHGVDVQRLGPRSRHRLGSRQVLYLLRFWWRAFWAARRCRADAVHCHDFITLPVGVLLTLFARKRLVYDAHESYADMLGANVAGWIKRCVRGLERFLIRRAHMVITVGDLLAAELQQRGARCTWVVGNWKSPADFDVAPEDTAAARAELDLGDGLVVVYVGWLNADRGIGQLLDAVSALPHVQLVIGGDGPFTPEVARAAAECPRVQYLGFVDPIKVPVYTAISDVIYYGLDSANPNAAFSAPNKLFEALAAGKAVVCNRCGEIGRIVAEEGCGVVVDELTSDALGCALAELADPGRRRACQEAARRAGAERYNWANAERTLLDAYADIGVAPKPSEA